jgi:hypothetical protein
MIDCPKKAGIYLFKVNSGLDEVIFYVSTITYSANCEIFPVWHAVLSRSGRSHRAAAAGKEADQVVEQGFRSGDATFRGLLDVVVKRKVA